MGITERKKIIKEIEEKRGSKVLCYLTSDRPNIPNAPNIIALNLMQKSILPIINELLRNKTKYDSIDVFIFTHGGDTLAGFGLSRLLREYCEDVNVFIPDCCHSSGTLFALGANKIHMSKGATLSPIDPSITGPLNPAVQSNPALIPQLIPLSVESVAGYYELISKSWKLNKRDELLKLLADKVHPLALGDVYRVRQQIEMLATQLLEQHRKDNKNIKKIVQRLSKGLGSHDYLIYFKEAKMLLGNQVVCDEEMEPSIYNLFKEYSEEMELGKPYNPETILSKERPNNTATIELNLAMIESQQTTYIAKQKIELTENIMTLQTPFGPQQQKQITQKISSDWVRV